MFGKNYSRSKFWLITILTFVLIGLPYSFVNMQSAHDEGAALVASGLLLLMTFFLINTLANRIRDYGSNPWLALWSILPLVGLFQALYYGIRENNS